MDFSLPEHTKASFASLYDEAALYRAVVKVYTKPLFFPRKALAMSHDERTLYDFARHTSRNVEGLHSALMRREFHFREGISCAYHVGGKRRTLYLFPWEERIVDQLLFQMLNRFFDAAFSNYSFAYRYRGFGADICQRRIARFLKKTPKPVYIIRRDVANFFPAIDHDLLLAALRQWVEPDDYLFQLLRERITFRIRTSEGVTTAQRGVAIGNPSACFFGNLYLTALDRQMTLPDLTYQRYADDMLVLSHNRDAALEAKERLERSLTALRLESKASQRWNVMFQEEGLQDDAFARESSFQYLGLEFCSDGSVRLPKHNAQKICRLFRAAFRRALPEARMVDDPRRRVQALVDAARRTLERGARAVAIVDYYLKHVDDERQLQLIDRWLAEELLSQALQTGHRKSNFRDIPFKQLRAMGLPSLRHRRRLLQRGKLKRPVVVLRAKSEIERKGSGCQVDETFSPCPEAAAHRTPVRKGTACSWTTLPAMS